MGKEDVVELNPGRDLEVVPSIELNQSKFDALIQFSQQTDKLGKALDRIRIFLLGRALPGDFVQHGDKIGPTGPATERMLSALGLMGVPVTFSKWESTKTTGADKNGDWYDWEYSADVEIGGLRLGRVEAHAGSRDKFFGFQHGVYKDLSDVKEADIRMSARRSVFKEAMKVALGLRGIPADQAQALGLDPSKIKKVEFGSAKEGTATSGQQADFVSVLQDVTIKREKANGSDGKGGYTIFAVKFANGVSAETFDKKIAEAAKALKGVNVSAKTAAAKDPKYAPTLLSVSKADAPQEGGGSYPAGDAQEPA